MDTLHYLKTLLSTICFLVHLLQRDIQNNTISVVIVHEHVCFYTLVSITVFLLLRGKKNPTRSVLYSEWSTPPTWWHCLLLLISSTTQMHRYALSSTDNHHLLRTNVFRCHLNKQMLAQILSSSSFLNSVKGNLQNNVAKFYLFTSLF